MPNNVVFMIFRKFLYFLSSSRFAVQILIFDHNDVEPNWSSPRLVFSFLTSPIVSYASLSQACIETRHPESFFLPIYKYISLSQSCQLRLWNQVRFKFSWMERRTGRRWARDFIVGDRFFPTLHRLWSVKINGRSCDPFVVFFCSLISHPKISWSFLIPFTTLEANNLWWGFFFLIE